MTPYEEPRGLIVTADDYGVSENINRGIEEGIEFGIVTGISVLTNFHQCHEDLAELVERYPHIGVGVHLNINTGYPLSPAQSIPSLVNPEGRFYTVEELLPLVLDIDVGDLETELRAQINGLRSCGIEPDHLSYHFGVLSLYHPFFDVILRLAEENGIPVRSPITASAAYRKQFPDAKTRKKAKSLVPGLLFRHPGKAIELSRYLNLPSMMESAEKAHLEGIPTPEVLFDVFWGDPTTERFLSIVDELPPGVSEVVVHLGNEYRPAEYPTGLDLDYFYNRERELEVVTDARIAEYLAEKNVRIVGYKALEEISSP